MRMLILLAVLMSPIAVRAESLAVDADLLSDAAMLLADGSQASASLPAAMDLVGAMAGVQSGSSGRSTVGGFGVGLQIGTLTALTFKFGAQNNANIVLGVGTGFGNRGYVFGLHLHGDYLFTVASLINNADINLSAYIGPGLWIAVFNANSYGVGLAPYYYGGNYALFGFGARLPLGLNLRFRAAPIEVYAELDPMLLVFPGIGFDIGGALGFRWFF